jgi:N utilization substance protein A
MVDSIHREKKIDKEFIFRSIESAITTSARKQYGESTAIEIIVDRETGEFSGTKDGVPFTSEELDARIGAQSARQVMTQKIKEAERDSLYEENLKLVDQIISGKVQRNDGSVTLIEMQGVEAVLPRSERIPGESLRNGDRVSALVVEVRKNGNKVKVVLSRTRPLFVQKLFEQEIPEIQDAVIEIKGVSREPGYRTKIAVYSSDQRIDCVGACIGMRGSRIREITDTLGNERIDVIPWSPDFQEYIPNALKPAEIEETILCKLLGRAIVLVDPEQRSLAIGRNGQNVRLATKLVGWDIEIMTREELDADLEKAIEDFTRIDGVTPELADSLVCEGFLTYDDLSIIEPDVLAEMGAISPEEAERIIEQAEHFSEQEELTGKISADKVIEAEEDTAEDAAEETA